MGRGTEKFTRKWLHWQRESDQEVSRIPWTEEGEKYKNKNKKEISISKWNFQRSRI